MQQVEQKEIVSLDSGKGKETKAEKRAQLCRGHSPSAITQTLVGDRMSGCEREMT